MASWQNSLKYNPTDLLLTSGKEQVEYFTKRDILDQPVDPIETLWNLKIPSHILRTQQPDGSWKYPGKTAWYTTDYSQLETYRQLGFLVQMFGLNKNHPAIVKAAEYFFSKQTDEGDFRGIYAAQYSPNYTAAIAELLILSGYGEGPRIQKVFNWLLEIRQDDGGWALPLRTKNHNLEVILHQSTIEPDKSMPFSHFVTGIVLRAFAAHPKYSQLKEVRKAGELLASRFFQNDTYTDLKKASAWQTFSYPFWNTDLISSLHILSALGFNEDDASVQTAVTWLHDQQTPDGSFDIHKNHDRYHDQNLWLAFATCRALKMLHENNSK